MSDNEITQGDKRQAFIDGLQAKASHALVTREEAMLLLQGVLAEMLTEVLPDLVQDVEKASDGVQKDNATTFLNIAKETRDEMLVLIDHAMSKRKTIKVSSFLPRAMR